MNLHDKTLGEPQEGDLNSRPPSGRELEKWELTFGKELETNTVPDSGSSGKQFRRAKGASAGNGRSRAGEPSTERPNRRRATVLGD